MKWKRDKEYDGELRIIRKFLWFPKTLDYETRWLEFANIKQEFQAGYMLNYWEDISWVIKNRAK
jgi:hypothetical protein